jgi:hypothetical protein
MMARDERCESERSAMPLPSGFEDRLRSLNDADVLAIIAKPDDYQPEAVALARVEVARRNLSADQVAVAAQVERTADALAEAKAEVPLSMAMRLLCFLLPLNPWMFFTAIGYGGYGYKRKARDAWLAMAAGVVFYFLLAIVLTTLVPSIRANRH